MGRKLNLKEKEEKVNIEKMEESQDNFSPSNSTEERKLFSFSVENEEYWKKRVEKLKKEKEFWDREKEKEEKEKREKRERRKVYCEFMISVLLITVIAAAVFWITKKETSVKLTNIPQTFSELDQISGFDSVADKDPITWDRNNPELWFIMAALSGSGAVWLLLSEKKGEES